MKPAPSDSASLAASTPPERQPAESRFARDGGSRWSWWLHAVFIVPKSQVHVLDFRYQVYVFELFHKVWPNRVSHYIGIPLHLGALFVWLAALAGTGVAWAAAAVLTALHVTIAVRSRLLPLAVLAAVVDLGLCASALTWLAPLLPVDAALWQHPLVFVLGWPSVQFATHLLEPTFPPPTSGRSGWASLRELLRDAGPTHLAKMALLTPAHAGVEVVSSYRNLLVALSILLRRLGVRQPALDQAQPWFDAQCAAAEPVMDYDAYRQAMPA